MRRYAAARRLLGGGERLGVLLALQVILKHGLRDNLAGVAQLAAAAYAVVPGAEDVRWGTMPRNDSRLLRLA